MISKYRPSWFCPGAVKTCLSPEEQTQMSNGRSHEYDGNDADYEFLIPMGEKWFLPYGFYERSF